MAASRAAPGTPGRHWCWAALRKLVGQAQKILVRVARGLHVHLEADHGLVARQNLGGDQSASGGTHPVIIASTGGDRWRGSALEISCKTSLVRYAQDGRSESAGNGRVAGRHSTKCWPREGASGDGYLLERLRERAHLHGVPRRTRAGPRPTSTPSRARRRFPIRATAPSSGAS